MATKRLAVALSIVVGALFAVPAAGGEVPRMGDRIGLGCALVGTGECTDMTFTANTPFYVVHGASTEPIAHILNPLRRFELSIDGQQVHGAIDLELDHETGLGDKLYVFNFPRGMTGTHTFTGCWYETNGAFLCGTRVVHFVE